MKPVDLPQLSTKSDSSSSAGSAVINLVSTHFRRSQQFFRMVHRILAEEFLSYSIQLIIITTVLGWNSHQVSIFLLYYNQQTRYTINVGSEPAICHLQVDILSYNLHTSLQIGNELTWHRHYIRPKPPWLYFLSIYTTYCAFLRSTLGYFSTLEFLPLLTAFYPCYFLQFFWNLRHYIQYNIVVDNTIWCNNFYRSIYNFITLTDSDIHNKRKRMEIPSRNQQSTNNIQTSSNKDNTFQQLYSKYCNSQFINNIIMLTTNSFSNKRPNDACTQHGQDFCDIISLEDANLPSRPPYE